MDFLVKTFLGKKIPWSAVPWNGFPWKKISLLCRITYEFSCPNLRQPFLINFFSERCFKNVLKLKISDF
jgi:hypothetical protein